MKLKIETISKKIYEQKILAQMTLPRKTFRLVFIFTLYSLCRREKVSPMKTRAERREERDSIYKMNMDLSKALHGIY